MQPAVGDGTHVEPPFGRFRHANRGDRTGYRK